MTRQLLRLTPLQEGLLYHAIESPAEGFHIVQVGANLHHNLNVEAMRKAWNFLLERHPPLRTRFAYEEIPRPMQIVDPIVAMPVEVRDCRGSSEREQKESIKAFLASDRAQGFRLDQSPLMRVTLFQLSQDDWQMVWTHHHLLIDGWSLPIIIAELRDCYLLLASGREPEFAAVPSYSEYIQWLDRQDPEKAKHFWCERVADWATEPRLGIERRVKGKAPSYQQLRVEVPDVLTGGLKRVCRQYRLTVNSALQGLFALLLGKYSEVAEVIFGTTLSGRPGSLRGVERMVGMFVNTLPVRLRLPLADESVVLWLGRVQKELLDLRDFEYCSLQDIQRWSALPAGTRLFNSLFVFENYPSVASRAQSGSAGLHNIQFVERTIYPLVVLAETSDGISFRALYHEHELEDGAVDKMLVHLQHLLTQFVNDPEIKASQLQVTTPEEEKQLANWNDTQRHWAGDVLTLHELFERQAARTPEQVAVITSDGTELRYGELDEMANRFAAYLSELGLRCGELVAINGSRGSRQIVALLAILKCGAAYVPFDASCPAHRFAAIAGANRIRYLVSDQRTLLGLSSVLKDLSGIEHILLVDGVESDVREFSARPSQEVHVWAQIIGAAPTRPNLMSSPDQLAYVIFTSGSTGVPKGVVVSHQPVVNTIRWVNEFFSVGCADRILFTTSLSFDLSVYDIFGLLATGGSIRIATEEELDDPAELVRILFSERITFWDSAPAGLGRVLTASNDVAAEGSPPLLRLIFQSGDWVPLSTHETTRTLFPSSQLVALGGATEAAIWSNYFFVERVDPSWASIPYGRPIPNARYYILDGFLSQSPPGLPGNLYIGGPCLANGYLGDRQLTASKFIPDPFANIPGSRMYVTGDRARFMPDGNIEFLGRNDNQVKICGFRIELGEVEATLSSHPDVQAATVVVRGDHPEDKTIAAFVVLRRGSTCDRSDLTEWLSRRLPVYMRPSLIRIVDAFPITSNGKVDRQALQACAIPFLEEAQAPADDVEEVLLGLMQETLGLESRGVTANFFELGGHSLLAAKYTSLIRRVLAVDLPVRAIFEHPTVRELATWLCATPEKTSRIIVAAELAIRVANEGLAISDVKAN